jgi:NAD(P)-dependent dehydrogenase (short-subunit alcohol dehydrogenase family)
MAPTFNPLDLTGRLVLVTGASSGIGRSTAVAISRLGARVALGGRREDALQETRAAMEGDGHVVAPFDLADVDGIPGWVKRVVADAGAPLAGVVHSAGVSRSTPLRVVTKANIDDILTPNLYATLALLRGVSAKGATADSCSVVIMSSVAGVAGTPGLSTYSASKGAIHALVRSAAQELGGKRIRVNCVAPGYVETPMLDGARDSLPGDFQKLADRHFLGFARPDEIAVAIAFLLSDAARVITGTSLVIDGGYST